eukprot:scaffold2084_cov155-Skeletonema_menzelii.AAC.24
MLLRGLTLPASTSPAPLRPNRRAGDTLRKGRLSYGSGKSWRSETNDTSSLRVTAASKARAGDGCFAAACGGPSMLFMIFIICSSK